MNGTPAPSPPSARPSRATPGPNPAEALADGIAAHVRTWARRAGSDDTTAAAAARAAHGLSLATSDGDVCVLLSALAAGAAGPGHGATDTPTTALRQRLLASGVVGTPAAPGAMPLVLDDDGRLYLHRYFDHEAALARRLLRAARAAPEPIDADSRALLARLFAPADGHALALDQQRAAALALRQRLVIVSGGPGTGKTTTVVNLLACLLARRPDTRVALAAPTGKAAARLVEAIRQRATHLPEALRERLPADASTIHRLLGLAPGGGPPRHHAGHPLAIDVLVVDEASMLDLALARRLLDAVPDSARIVMLGDKDQLSAVESGAVFSELSANPALSAACRRDLATACGLPPPGTGDAADAGGPAGSAAPAGPGADTADTASIAARPGAETRAADPATADPLCDSVVWFTQNFRFAAGSGIGRLAADINGAHADAAIGWLRRGEDAAVRWIDDGSATPDAATLAAMAQGLAAYLDAVRRHAFDPAAAASAFGRFRVLCAMRDGPRGVTAVNGWLTRHALAALAALKATTPAAPPGTAGAAGDHRFPPVAPDDPDADARAADPAWYPGRPVMVLRNDAALKLFNGDIGIALPDDLGRMMVWFPQPDGSQRAVAPVRLPLHETAYAMTVHKSQGSEFDEVLVLLPAQRSRVLGRELLYTAVTRARQRVVLSGPAAVLSAAIRTATQRRSGLPARLREAVDASNPVD